jgi:hypothetical protein
MKHSLVSKLQIAREKFSSCREIVREHTLRLGYTCTFPPLDCARGLRAVRYFGFCHPAAKIKRERIAFHTGRPLDIGAVPIPAVKPPHVVICSCCGEPMAKAGQLLPAWRGDPAMAPPSTSSRAPPPLKRSRV